MLDKWTVRFILLFIMLMVPFGVGFGILALSNIDFSNYSYIPALLAITFILVTIGDVVGIVLLILSWIKEDSL
ncbi:hypothetical protein ACFLV1_03010 [Chloroflexota bacterium]